MLLCVMHCHPLLMRPPATAGMCTTATTRRSRAWSSRCAAAGMRGMRAVAWAWEQWSLCAACLVLPGTGWVAQPAHACQHPPCHPPCAGCPGGWRQGAGGGHEQQLPVQACGRQQVSAPGQPCWADWAAAVFGRRRQGCGPCSAAVGSCWAAEAGRAMGRVAHHNRGTHAACPLLPFQTRYGIIYAGAQKNIGPAGVTIVIVRDDLIGNARCACGGAAEHAGGAEEDCVLARSERLSAVGS